MTTLAPSLASETTVVPATALVGIGTALPNLRVGQADILDFILKRFGLSEPAKALYRRAMRGDAIAHRHFALNALEDCLSETADQTIARFEREATALSVLSLNRALRSAAVPAPSIDFLVAATCTGYLCPGLSAYILEKAGLRRDTRLADVVGMGCGAALPALEQASNFVRANPGTTAAVVCTEISSAALYADENPGIIVSNAIFADGSAAVILKAAGEGKLGGGAVRLRSFASETRPEWRDTLRFRTEQGRLKNILARTVPAQAGEALASVAAGLLSNAGLDRSQIDHWVLHAGGSRVLDEAERSLGLPAKATALSRGVLRNCGNMSSPTVLFVLAEQLSAAPPSARSGFGVMASFGAGFSAHAALLEF